MARTFTKLTRPAMRSLPKGASIIEHGITFTREANGDGLFTVNVMVDRQRIHRTIGRESDGTTRTTCEDFIAKARQDARNGRLNLPKRRKVALTFAEAAKQYIKNLEDSGGRNLSNKRQQLEQYLVPFFGALPLQKISTFDIERYKKEVLENASGFAMQRKAANSRTVKSAATVNRHLATLSHLLAKAMEWGWMERAPGRVKKLREDGRRTFYLSSAQASHLLATAEKDSDPYVYAFILIGLRTAMRKSEILAIRKADIDLNAKTIYVPHAKAGARSQPITPGLAKFLADYIALNPDAPWLFPSSQSKSGHVQDMRRSFERVVRAAGLDPKAVLRHTLRHTAITHMVQAGVDLPTVQRFSGHKTLSMVARYAHQSGNHIAQAMEKLDDRYKETG